MTAPWASGPAVKADDRGFRARALGALFAAGGALGLLGLLVPHGTDVDAWAWAANSLVGLVVGALVFAAGRRVPTWLIHVLLATGAAEVSLGLRFGGGGSVAVATSFLYVWIALYVGWFFSPRAVVLHLVWLAGLFAIMLAFEDEPGGPAIWLLVVGTAVVVAVVVSLMRRELIAIATLDALTGLPTRVTLDDALTREIARARRYSTPLCVAAIDVDGLKAVNDSYGHKAGDQALIDAATAWRTGLRRSDVLVRFGGDEFVAVLPDCAEGVAAELVERLRTTARISCSVGLAWWIEGETPADLLERADSDLYRAKRAREAGHRT